MPPLSHSWNLLVTVLKSVLCTRSRGINYPPCLPRPSLLPFTSFMNSAGRYTCQVLRTGMNNSPSWSYSPLRPISSSQSASPLPSSVPYRYLTDTHWSWGSLTAPGSATSVILRPQFRPCSAYDVSGAPHNSPHSSALHRAPPRTRPPLAWSLTTQNTPTGFVFPSGQKTVTFCASVQFFVCLYLSAGLLDQNAFSPSQFLSALKNKQT